MSVLITKKFRFESAHYLPAMPEGHKCRRLHGHSFNMDINLLGEVDPDTGLLMDFGDIKKVVKPYIDMLDHWCINEVAEENGIELLKNPSSENLAKWFFHELKGKLPGLYSVTIHETCTTRCEYRESFD
ncbi:MAG: 6-carboxytetrahydropterin synthase QueD [Bacteroidota bacterium]